MTIKNVLPTSIILADTIYQLEFQLDQKINTFENISVKYDAGALPPQIQPCSIKTTQSIQCRSPIYPSSLIANIHLSLSGQPYVFASKKITIISSMN